MPTALNPADYPNERSTLPLTLAFTDAAGAPLTLDTLAWSLYDGVGAIVNDRDAVALTPAASVALTPYGDDLIIGASGPYRAILLRGTFTSDLGAGLPWTEEITFMITKLAGVP